MDGWMGGRTDEWMDGRTKGWTEGWTGVHADRWADGWAARPCFGAAFCRGRGRGTKSLSSSLLLVYMSSASMAVNGRVAANEEAIVKFVVVLGGVAVVVGHCDCRSELRYVVRRMA